MRISHPLLTVLLPGPFVAALAVKKLLLRM